MRECCPLKCGEWFINKLDIENHVKVNCPKVLLIKDDYSFCENDCFVIIDKRQKYLHCEKCFAAKKTKEKVNPNVEKDKKNEENNVYFFLD